MAGLQIDRIEKSFGDTRVLRGISLDIADGEFVSLVGPSGCGKSTLLRIIAGLEHQSAGHIRIGGRDVSGIRAAERNLSMVFQSYALYPHLSVGDNIAVPLRMRRLNAMQRLPLLGRYWPGARAANVDINQAVSRAARTLEIDALLARKPGQLSGGQRQRVALGRALVREPAAFLLDEPLSNLDAKLRVQTRSEIAQLHRRLGATFVYVTHDQVEAMTMSSRIAVMMRGEILQCAAPETIYDDPDDIRVAEFIGSPRINVLPAEHRSGALSVLEHPLPLRVPPTTDQFLRIGLRPEALRLCDPATAPLSGRVAHVENLGAELFAQIAIDAEAERVVVKAAPADRPRLALGTRLGLDFDPGAAMVFDAAGKRLRRVTAARPRAGVVA
ncbi:ABC transporter ATP-binding protein [Ruegeria pomeroyi]|uniref:Sugar ABC transporter, ATP-binding protein n=2 Tax=Ruegeria pomeroyi TaxID=89184 RepID=Q5LSE5_RUEPO|nr:ABC transporter ATP-binding protein [Ruegeria pomeroyi]AAV95102.1 sugar ABC transporter, ATP-binding protein [Ruegeria pomeroyi DSS-3]NVK99135.1 ABC transporter ATP-binding protein [Ruegeria pomeroyi]NVL00799.1 ABC transporter ATP-binding protein [Ruegeria pomeroyi]QWV08677.1 ABC transporter ATP-binding protein [Ruegeria pomeroyi]